MATDFWTMSESGSDLTDVRVLRRGAHRASAERLAEYAGRVSGCRLDVTACEHLDGITNSIALGTCGDLAECGLPLASDLSTRDAFLLRANAERGNLYIVGADAFGLLCGVNHFLETCFGIRWLTPWDTHAPSHRTVHIPKDLDERAAPAFALRGFHICGSGRDRRGELRDHYDERVLEWMRSNRMNMKFLHNGELDAVAPDLHRLDMTPLCLGNAFDDFCPKGLFSEHPDFFPLIGGNRVGSGVIKRCLGNPRFQGHFAERAVAFLRAHPEAETVAIQPSDGLGWCECDACRAMDTPEDRSNGTVSGRVYRFADTIARRVQAELPGRRVAMSAYSNWSEPPAGMQRIPNLLLAVTTPRCHAHSLDDDRCETNRLLFDRVRRCAQVAGRVLVYDYLQMGGMPVPVCRAQCRSLEALRRTGVQGYFCEVSAAREDWLPVMLPLYVLARKLWRLGADPTEITADFCAHYYGPARDAMAAYHVRLEDAIEKADCEYPAFRGERAADFLTAGVAAECRHSLRAARQAAGAEAAPWRARIMEQEKLLGTWEHVCRAIRKGDLGPDAIVSTAVAGGRGAFAEVSEKAPPVPIRRRTLFTEMGSIRVAHDGRHVFLLFECHEPDMPMAQSFADPANALAGSHVDFFLSPKPETGVYYQFAVNIAGAKLCQKCRGREWDSSFQPDAGVQVEAEKDGWRMLVRVPAESMGEACVPSSGAWKAGLNIVRYRTSSNRVGGWPSGGAFHDIARFGRLCFG